MALLYKGLDKDLKCRGHQFEFDEDYEEPKPKLCERGYHGCENPLDVFSYYAPADSRYCEVEIENLTDERGEDSKRCGKKIRLKAEIGLSGIASAGVEFILDKVTWEDSPATNTGDYSAATNTGNQSAATNTGNYSAATNTGNQSAATNTGNRSAATNTGNQSAATNTGDYSAATNTGYYSAATNTGDYSAATNTGYRSAATNTGNRSAATNTGNQSAATVGGKDSVAIATGFNSKARGSIGCAIVVVERGEWNGNTHPIIHIRSAIVDGEKIKADTYYKVIGGEWVEAD